MITHGQALALMGTWLAVLAICSAAAFLLGRRYGRGDDEERQELAETPGWGRRAWAEANKDIYNRPAPSRPVPPSSRQPAGQGAQRFTRNPQPPIGQLARPPRRELTVAGIRATDFIRAITEETDAYIREMSR